jgi:5-methyltetrahydrofolate--homocysteine methyltransferase
MSHSDLREQLAKRILVLDGAMGSMIQRYRLGEADFRGTVFQDHPTALKGDNEALCLTAPHVIHEIHSAYLEAGADIIETNTFSANRISQADYGLDGWVYQLNVAAAQIARKAVDEAVSKNPARPRFVAGAIGPTNRTLSIATKADDPGYREFSFDDFREAYREQVRGLLDGGVDILLCETTFDTLVLKAALVAIEEEFENRGLCVPVFATLTVSDQSKRLLSGQTIEAFWISINHFPLSAVGMNCGLGARQMRSYLDELSSLAHVPIICYPNAGLPNAFGGFDETPEMMAEEIAGFAKSGLVNIVGGCCGTTPDHIRAIAEVVRDVPPRRLPEPPRLTAFSGLEPLVLRPETGLVVIGERTNVTGSPRFKKAVLAENWEEALSIARQQVDNGANMIDVNMDEGMLDAVRAMTTFLNLVASEPAVARVPIMVDSSNPDVIEAALKCIQGKAAVNSISLKEGEEKFLDLARRFRRYGAALVVMAFDEQGQAVTTDRKVAICERAYRLPGRHHL